MKIIRQLLNGWRCSLGLNPKTKAIPISDDLREFLTKYLWWAESWGAENHQFSRTSGLCFNALHFRDSESGVSIKRKLIERLEYDFKDAFYPFGGYDLYTADSRDQSHHTNEMRLSWIRQVLK